MNRVASRAAIAFLLAVLLIAGLGFFVAEYVMNARQWVMFPGSPHLYTGGNLGCGTVTDREGTLLLDLNEGRVYAQSEELRKSTVHWLGDRRGSISAPALASYADEMVGFDLLNGIYSYGGNAGSAQLTLSGSAQIAALNAMGDRKGTVAVYNYRTGELLCAVTTPCYDPDAIPDLETDTEGKYEGMYLNRFTQAVYIPGSIFKIVTLAAALEEFPDAESFTFQCKGKLEVDGSTITCEEKHGKQSLQTAFMNSCNCAFAELAMMLGGETMERYVDQFGVVAPVTFDGIETAAGNYEAAGQSQLGIAWSGSGQYLDQINPCSFLAFVGAVAGGGDRVTPYLVQSVFAGTDPTYTAERQQEQGILSRETAETVAAYMRNNVQNHYGDEHFPGLNVCAKTGTAEVGGDKKPNAMLAGFVSDPQYPLAFIVCVEDGGYGAKVCLPVASAVLEACVNSMKSVK